MQTTTNNLHCRICGNVENNTSYMVAEKMFGSKEEFMYIKCAKCGCMQLADEDIDESKYYPENYFAYNTAYKPNALKDFLGKEYIKYRLGKFSLIGMLAYPIFKNNAQTWIDKNYLNFNSTILDVGCASGRLIHLLHCRGFKNVTGVEPYNRQEIVYSDNVVVYNKSIYEINSKYDFVMLNYSLEHMPYPHKALQKISSILNDNGSLLIRIPIIDCYAWKHYGVNWVQMDAPRHIYLYTVQALKTLCEEHGLELQKTIYDSSEYQFIYSERYLRKIPYNDTHNYFSKKQIREFKKHAKQLNAAHEGDQVSCYFKKIKK